jgi:CheY-like chemotaxis protein
MKPIGHILWIDNDVYIIDRLIKYLEIEGFMVTTFSNVDDCIGYLDKKPKVDIFILDLMMPCGKALTEEDTKGRETGILLCHFIRNYYPEIPIVFFTVATDKFFGKELKELCSLLGGILILRKGEAFPERLASDVKQIIENGLKIDSKYRLLTLIGDSLLLQPNIAGIGIDIIKLSTKILKRYKKIRKSV